jgi:hypothetical protein
VAAVTRNGRKILLRGDFRAHIFGSEQFELQPSQGHPIFHLSKLRFSAPDIKFAPKIQSLRYTYAAAK